MIAVHDLGRTIFGYGLFQGFNHCRQAIAKQSAERAKVGLIRPSPAGLNRWRLRWQLLGPMAERGSLLDNRRESTLRLYQSMTATRYKTPRRIHRRAGDLQGKSAKRGDVRDINAPFARQGMFTCPRGRPDLAA